MRWRRNGCLRRSLPQGRCAPFSPTGGCRRSIAGPCFRLGGWWPQRCGRSRISSRPSSARLKVRLSDVFYAAYSERELSVVSVVAAFGAYRPTHDVVARCRSPDPGEQYIRRGLEAKMYGLDDLPVADE